MIAASDRRPSRQIDASAVVKSGTLYGLGLGPGDPELVTLKAARILASTRVVAYPTLPATESFARTIARDLIANDAEEIAIEIPMTSARAPAQSAYARASEVLAKILQSGRDVAVLCEGDPFFYGSFMYLYARLAGRFPSQVVPGVSSLTACAAVAGRPIAARNEVLTVLPGPLPDAALVPHLAAADTLIVMKIGRHLGRLRALLETAGLAGQATYVERATLGTERVLPLSEAPDPAPYFSMILVAKGADPWL